MEHRNLGTGPGLCATIGVEVTVTYLDCTARVSRETPASRNRIIDFWRAVAILAGAIGHWLAASIWLQPND